MKLAASAQPVVRLSIPEIMQATLHRLDTETAASVDYLTRDGTVRGRNAKVTALLELHVGKMVFVDAYIRNTEIKFQAFLVKEGTQFILTEWQPLAT